MSYFGQLVLTGVIASRPAAAIQGRLYFATDTGFWYLDSGSAWSQLVPAPAQYIYSGLPGSPIVGQEAWVTDATTNTWGANVTAGSGGDAVRVEWNGTNWTVTGK